MQQAEILLIYLFLVRLITAILVLILYLKNRSAINFIFFISTTVYAMAALFLVFADKSIFIAVLAGVFAILGLYFVLISILNLVYKFKSKHFLTSTIIILTLVLLSALFGDDISRIIVLSTQAVIVILALIGVLARKKDFKKRLGSSHGWLLTSLISGNMVIGVHVLSIILNQKFDFHPEIFTFMTSLMIAVFFVQLENITQNRRLYSSNQQLIEEKVKLEKVKNEQTAMISNISDVITILDDNAVIKYISPNVEVLFGWKPEEIVNQYGFKFLHPDSTKYASNDFKNFIEGEESIVNLDAQYRCGDGQYKMVNITMNNLIHNPDINGVLINYHDVSEQRKLEKEKLQMEAHARNQQALESIGTFAAGVAHEINNPINGIMNYAQIINDMPENSEEITEYTNEIIHESERVAGHVKNLLQFARQDNEEFNTIHPEEILDKTLPLIRTIMRHDQITLQVDIKPSLPYINCRSRQIQQIIMNLLTNARDALNERYEGYHEDKICRVTCKVHQADDKEFLRIMVEDHGNGISDEVKNKIFNPFFTTKAIDKGTGLGLSISSGIAKEHNGELGFVSKENEYTLFYLDLPV